MDVEKEGPRIRWHDTDEEANRRHNDIRPLQRTASRDSIRSFRSRRNSIDPAIALPIQYRTVSFHIAESQDKTPAASATRPAKLAGSAADELSLLEWHVITALECLQRLTSSDKQGLSAEQVARRIKEHGRNVPSKPPTHHVRQIFNYLFGGFGSILFVGAILVFVSWKPLGNPPAQANLALAIVLLAVFVIQAVFRGWQDWSSSKVMRSITTMLPDHSLVLRDGAQQEISAQDLVPGDILFVKAGSKLPADVRFLVVSSDAKFDRAILTGESVPLSGSVDATDTNYLETQNVGLQGTHCVSGNATGIVVATGDKTVFGRIAKLTSQPKTGMSTLEKEILRFVTIIVSIMIIMILIVITVWAGYLRKRHPDWINVPTLIVACVSIAVAFIPEGLPIALTASLTIIANIMRSNSILCKSLKTVETLGAVSVICSDKTGTLTTNTMNVTEYSIGSSEHVANGPAKNSEDTTEGVRDRARTGSNPISSNALDQLRFLAGVCNAGEFDAGSMSLPLADRKILGDATDQAILRFAECQGSVSYLRRLYRTTYNLAFNSKNKYMIRTVNALEANALQIALPTSEHESVSLQDTILTIKGAPDVLLDRCSQITSPDGTTQALTNEARVSIELLKNRWAAKGRRVLLLARKVVAQASLPTDITSNDFEKAVNKEAYTGLVLVGLVGIVDPPRPEIPEVVRTLRRAGVRFFMVTGDFALTAQAIAAECGIITTSNAGSVHGVKQLNLLRAKDSTDTDDTERIVAATANSYHSTDPVSAPSSSIVISGPELISLSDAQWSKLCAYDEIVFARTTPEQKLRIVREFQHRDEIVGMTGDGVNDAPSLKAADIGIALGSGSDIAIEAADMVLLESFAAVVEAVKYGRVVFDNLKKTIAYLLPAGSFAEFWPVMTNVVFGLPQILSSFLMIIICCFTDCAAATVLAYEKPEADVLLRRPRNPKKDRLVDWKLMLQAYGILGLLETVCAFAMSYWYLQRSGLPFSAFWFKYGLVPEGVTQEYYTARLNEASSIYFITLVVMQWFNLMAVRTRRLSIFQHPPAFNKQTQNLLLFPAILFALVMAILWNYIPPLQKTLATSNIPIEHFFFPATFGLGILLLDEGRKFAVRRWPKGILAKISW